MPEIQIQIKNIAEIKRAFIKSPILMTRELNKAIKTSVIEISRDSRSNTPVDTGRLRSSTYELFTNLKGELGTNVAYDIFVHEGTRYMRPRPYLRKAVEKNEERVQTNFEKAVQNVLDQIGSET
jgi:HK97 gp10 family phage protein